MFTVGRDVYLLGTHGDDHHVISPPNTVPMKGGPVTISKSTDSGVTVRAAHEGRLIKRPKRWAVN